MGEHRQAYLGHCGGESGLQLLIRLTHPEDREWPETTIIPCPMQDIGNPCPDGGHHRLIAISDTLHDELNSEEER